MKNCIEQLEAVVASDGCRLMANVTVGRDVAVRLSVSLSL